MKKFTAMMLTAICCFSFGSAAWAFSDVAGLSETQQKAIEELSELKIIDGYIDGTFLPENNLTRAEFAKVATLAMQERTGAIVAGGFGGELSYSDVKKDGWYIDHIGGAVSLGLMKGDAEGTFRPNDNISTNEVVTVLMRILGYDDAALGGTWPDNYLDKAAEIGLTGGSISSGECNRADAATLTAAMLKLPLAKESITDSKVAYDNYGLITGINGKKFTMYSFGGASKTWTVGDDCKWSDDIGELTAGMLVGYKANEAGVLLELSREDVKTNSLPDAVVADGKITLGGRKYTISDSVDVLLMNSAGGVSTVSAEKVLSTTYVASLRSSRYQAPLQYVLSGNLVVGMVIGDYGSNSDTLFGYLEYYGEGADGTVVQFYDDDTCYLWDYVGKGENKEPQYDVLYAYDYDADGVEAYEVGVDSEEIKNQVVKRVSAICQTENGQDFIVNDETVIIKVKYEDAAKKIISDAEYVDEVEEGDIIRVRYTKPSSKKTGIEAAYIIIDDTDK